MHFDKRKDKEKEGENYKVGEQGRTHTWHMLPRGFGNHFAERILYTIWKPELDADRLHLKFLFLASTEKFLKLLPSNVLPFPAHQALSRELPNKISSIQQVANTLSPTS